LTVVGCYAENFSANIAYRHFLSTSFAKTSTTSTVIVITFVTLLITLVIATGASVAVWFAKAKETGVNITVRNFLGASFTNA